MTKTLFGLFALESVGKAHCDEYAYLDRAGVHE